MGANATKDTDDGADVLTSFNVKVCSKDGRLLSEYTLTPHQHNVVTLSAAERRAYDNLLDNYGEPLILIVGEETLTKLRQVQRQVAANTTCSA